MQYFIIVASKDHVEIGVDNEFAQAGHGEKAQIQKLKRNDWIIYYSSKDQYKNGNQCQAFTAIGQVTDNEPY
ncbi:MAG: EVE domain-containing protein, partial [Bacteroidetes bacterium SW_10_40_5]